jgi:formylglycine-generating enzyme required for sulfatase activity
MAAAGGDEQRQYPWGSTQPGASNQYAIYGTGCYYPNGLSSCSINSIAPVGSASKGAGRWGQVDLAGDMWEFALDFYGSYTPCVDCANFTPGPQRVIRGDNYGGPAYWLNPWVRIGEPAVNADASVVRDYNTGFRCARTP